MGSRRRGKSRGSVLLERVGVEHEGLAGDAVEDAAVSADGEYVAQGTDVIADCARHYPTVRVEVDRAPVEAPSVPQHKALRYAREETNGNGAELIAPTSYLDDASPDFNEQE